MAEGQAGEEGAGGLVRGTLDYLARSLVQHTEDVAVTAVESERALVLQLRVNPEDMGRVIGKQGHTARALRQVVKAAAAKAGVHATVEIVE